MKRILITHNTEYRYHVPVTFGEHQVMLRPREGHDVHIKGWRQRIEPKADVQWVRDIYGNSIALLTFAEPARKLKIASEIEVDLFEEDDIQCPIKSIGKLYPFQYAGDEQVEIMSYRIPSYPHDGPALADWLRDLYSPGEFVQTWDLLNRLNTRIFETLEYNAREEPGVQLPCETLSKRKGTCRDYAVLMMEAVRQWGFASRFVTGYIQMREGQHGATHAWTEVYLPGAGWRGFDSTNNKLAGSEHISVAVARSQEKAMPVSGCWSGPADAFDGMDVVVTVVPV